MKVFMNETPLAYFLTWTCYGTWLPGDDRGWTKWHKEIMIPQPRLADWCRGQMAETPIFLDQAQREIVEATIGEHCAIRGWHLHAVNCRSNHCHCVVTAPDYNGEQVRDQLKSWCTRKLKEAERRKPPGGVAYTPDGLRRSASGPDGLRDTGPDGLRRSASGPDGLRDAGPDGLRDAGPDGLRDAGPDGLRRAAKVRKHWWTAKGSVRHLYDDESLAAAVTYTMEAQEIGGSHANQSTVP